MAETQDFMVDVRTGAPVVGIPSKLGKYRIIGQLGRGGMADLYLGVALGLGGFSKLHVLKLVRSDSFDSEDAVRMFVNEARVTALLNHPNIVQTYEVDVDNGVVFMVMEYLEGQSLDIILSQVQRSGTSGGFDMGMRMRLRIVSDVLNGLHHAHELKDLEGQPVNLVHRDVTPHNIFVTYDGSIKLLEFGAAKTTSPSSPTRVGTIKGKVAYMAPEQVNSPAKICRATDIFQIGLVLWEGVVGRGIWQGLSEYEVLLKLSSNAPLPIEPPPDADAELVRICRCATALAPEDRYATAEDFNRDLESFMTERGIRVTAKQVGAYVAGLFEQRRGEVREAIHRRLKDIQVEPARSVANADGAPPAFVPAVLGGPTQTGSGSLKSLDSGSLAAFSSHPSQAGTSASGVAVTPARRDWSIVAILAVVVAAILGGAVLAMVAAPRKSPEVTSSVSGTMAMPVEQKSQQVELSVEAIPASARLYLDNGLLPSNPFTGHVPKDATVHVVRAEAEGYEKASLMVRFDGNTKNVLKLPESRRPTVTDLPPLPHSLKRTSAAKPRAPSVARPTPQRNDDAPEVPKARNVQDTSPSVRLDNSDPWK